MAILSTEEERKEDARLALTSYVTCHNQVFGPTRGIEQWPLAKVEEPLKALGSAITENYGMNFRSCMQVFLMATYPTVEKSRAQVQKPIQATASLVHADLMRDYGLRVK